VAGLIKAALAVHHGVVPPQWRPGRINPALRLDEAGLVLPTEPEPWGATDRIAVVNSFGYGGTNAHAVLGAAPAAVLRSGGRVRALPVSAAGEAGLRARAGQLARALAAGTALPALAGALAHRRATSRPAQWSWSTRLPESPP
jgi:acyl transferase domain-containing protein